MVEQSINESVEHSVINDSALDIDDIDHRIISLLRKDGRMPFRALAKELGITETTIRARVRRMEETDTMRVVAVTDFEAVGYTMMLAVGVQVQGRGADEVARDLAAHREVFSACQVVGSMDIEVLVVAKDQDMLSELISQQLAKVPGVRRIVPALAMEVMKNQPNWVPFSISGEGVTEAIAGTPHE